MGSGMPHLMSAPTNADLAFVMQFDTPIATGIKYEYIVRCRQPNIVDVVNCHVEWENNTKFAVGPYHMHFSGKVNAKPSKRC